MMNEGSLLTYNRTICRLKKKKKTSICDFHTVTALITYNKTDNCPNSYLKLEWDLQLRKHLSARGNEIITLCLKSVFYFVYQMNQLD